MGDGGDRLPTEASPVTKRPPAPGPVSVSAERAAAEALVALREQQTLERLRRRARRAR
jgi:hypothetical protein